MIFPRNIHALDHFKRNTPEFRKRLKETGEPEVLTVDGKAELVVLSAAAFDDLLERLDELEALEGVLQGLADVKAGRVRPAESAFADLFRKHGISDEGELKAPKRA